MRSIFKNVLLGSLIFTMPMMGFAEEIKPFKYIKNEDSYPKNIGLYKINTGNNWLFINQKPFHIDNQTKDVNFKGEIDAQCEDLEKVYKKNSKVFVITSTCWVWYGAKSSQKDYFIYEFNSSAKLVKTITISFDDEDREIYIKAIK